MAKGKKQYVAVNGISFDGLKGKPRIEAGDFIPEEVNDATIKDLLASGDIREVSPVVDRFVGAADDWQDQVETVLVRQASRNREVE